MRERARQQARKIRQSDPWAGAKAYAATYVRRWKIPHERCAGCDGPKASPYPPDPESPRTYVWLCRACVRIAGEIMPVLVRSDRLRDLAKPEITEDDNTQGNGRAQRPEGTTSGKDPRTFDQLVLAPKLLATARMQLAIAARQRGPEITALATYYLALLGEEDRAAIERTAAGVDLTKWRPYGEDDLDLSIINLFYRRRQRELARSKIVTDGVK